MSAEDPMAIIESFATQILQEDVLPLTTRDFAAVVDSVTTDDVNQVFTALVITDCTASLAVLKCSNRSEKSAKKNASDHSAHNSKTV